MLRLLQDQCVDSDFLHLKHSLAESRGLRVSHGRVLSHTVVAQGFPDDFNNEDPMMVLMEFMRLCNLRLEDLFTSLDKEGSKSLTRSEFKDGLLVRHVGGRGDMLLRMYPTRPRETASGWGSFS